MLIFYSILCCVAFVIYYMLLLFLFIYSFINYKPLPPVGSIHPVWE
jgi:hypothetical protein